MTLFSGLYSFCHLASQYMYIYDVFDSRGTRRDVGNVGWEALERISFSTGRLLGLRPTVSTDRIPEIKILPPPPSSCHQLLQ